MALSPLSSHTVHRGNSLRVLGGSRGTVSSMDGHTLPGRLPELSNFYCLPGRAGGSPLPIRGSTMSAPHRIDVHQHVVPPFWAKALPTHGGDPSGARSGDPSSTVLPRWSPESAIEFMD